MRYLVVFIFRIAWRIFCTTKLERQRPRVNRTMVREAGVGYRTKVRGHQAAPVVLNAFGRTLNPPDKNRDALPTVWKVTL